jgi:hypothetical protein
MPQEEINFKSLKSDNETLERLFIFFLQKLPSIYQRNNKTIPFIIAEITLCNHRINKEDARKLLKEFVKCGFLKVVKFRGFKVNFSKVTRLLEDKTIAEFAQQYGLNSVCSDFFQQLVYMKAKSDTEFWLKHAPHKLGESDE